MQPYLVLIILKYLKKRCQTYIWEMFCLYGLKIQKLQGIIEFLGKKIKLRTKQVFMRLLFCAMFWKAIYKCYATRGLGLGLGLEEKSITSCPH